MVRDHLVGTSRRLREQLATGQVENADALLSSRTAWMDHEKRLTELPEWPYSASIGRSLVISSFLPVAIGIIQMLLSETLLRFLARP